MSEIRSMGGVAPGAASKVDESKEKLRGLSHEFEALFLKQMLDVMRESIPDGGLVGSSMGEDTFTSMLDDRLASEAARRSQDGLGEALYRQLARRLESGDATSR